MPKHSEIQSKIFLKPYQDERVLNGHLWIFSNEIERKVDVGTPGSLVQIYSNIKKFLGIGFYNPHSLIAVRILTDLDEKISIDFFIQRIQSALEMRKQIYPGENAYRLVFGESDRLPGLIIDRYENCFAVQSNCLGMDILIPQIVEALKFVFKDISITIILKNDSELRTMENLEQEVKVIHGKTNFPIQIQQKFGDEQIYFSVDPIGGQKSGFFFDQRENRELFSKYCSEKKVLDCYSYTGAFGIYAAKNNAQEITSVDSSEPACQLIKSNFESNKINGNIICDDVESVLEQFKSEKHRFDTIVLDPPALAKTKKNLFGALRKYQKINSLALSLLNPKGILLTCSCSHHVDRSAFIKMIQAAAIESKRSVQLLEMRGQSKDHPIFPAMPETDYLKCAVIRAN